MERPKTSLSTRRSVCEKSVSYDLCESVPMGDGCTGEQFGLFLWRRSTYVDVVPRFVPDLKSGTRGEGPVEMG